MTISTISLSRSITTRARAWQAAAARCSCIWLARILARPPAVSRSSKRRCCGCCNGWGRAPELSSDEAALSGSALILAMAEDRRADADMGGAELDRGREVGAHAHGQILQAVARGDFRGQREMRRGRIVDRWDAHQAGNRQTEIVAAARDERVRLRWRDTRLLRLFAGI